MQGTLDARLKLNYCLFPDLSHFSLLSIFKEESFVFLQFFIQHCFIRRPLDSSVSEDAGIESEKAVSTIVYRKEVTRDPLFKYRLQRVWFSMKKIGGRRENVYNYGKCSKLI